VWWVGGTVRDGRRGVLRADATGLVVRLDSVALEGDPTPLGGTFKQFPSSLVPTIGASGAVAFRATLEGTSASSGAFVSTPGSGIASAVAAGNPSGAGVLVRLREVGVAGDGSVVVRASQSDGTPGLFLVRGGVVTPFALLGDATDLGSAVRFSDASLRDRAEDGVFLGVREGLMVATASGE